MMRPPPQTQTSSGASRSVAVLLLGFGLAAGCAQVLGIEEIEPWSGAGAGAAPGGNGSTGGGAQGGGPLGGGGAGAQGGELPAGCTDDEQSGTETDVDCGGEQCPACENGLHCQDYTDCESQFCDDSAGPPGQCLACGGDEDCAGAAETYCVTGSCVPKLDVGESCAESRECQSGYCVDDVCCGSACDGGCDACDVAGSEGACTVLGDGELGDGTCAPYLCDGVLAGCPTSCVDGADCLPDPDAYCGNDKICHGTKPLGTACQNGGECASDYCVDEVCCSTEACGTATDCNVCNRPSSLGTCATAADNASCDDGLYCNGWDRCVAGACGDHAGDPCTGADGDADCSESCSETSDDCSGNDANGSACSDGAYCNGADTCANGSCATHAGDPCAASVGDGDSDCSEACDDSTDSCSGNDPINALCNDGLYCTVTDRCNSTGVCVGTGDPCAANVGDNDADCSESCNDSTDSCTANDPANAVCNDGLYCTVTDRCNSTGVCVGTGDPCAANVGDNDADCSESCNDSTDSCTANDPANAVCNDGLYCTVTDRCNSTGVCVGTGDPCAANVGDNDNDCSESCNDLTDSCTANDPANAVCNDGLYCTVTDRCNSTGVCVGTGDPCPGPDGDADCSETCNDVSNNCTANDPDDMGCSGGGCCYNGICQPYCM